MPNRQIRMSPVAPRQLPSRRTLHKRRTQMPHRTNRRHRRPRSLRRHLSILASRQLRISSKWPPQTELPQSLGRRRHPNRKLGLHLTRHNLLSSKRRGSLRRRALRTSKSKRAQHPSTQVLLRPWHKLSPKLKLLQPRGKEVYGCKHHSRRPRPTLSQGRRDRSAIQQPSLLPIRGPRAHQAAHLSRASSPGLSRPHRQSRQ